MNEELNARARALLPAGSPDSPAPERSAEDRAFYEGIGSQFGHSVAAFFEAYEKRRVVLSIDPNSEPRATGSYIGGHPFVSSNEDFSWPLDGNGEKPLTFLMQVNLAELPRLEGFPESGLIQWWIEGGDELYGLSFDEESTGREGLLVRFYSADELSNSASSPSDPIPNRVDEDELGPFWGTKPYALVGEETLSFPSYEESTIPPEAFELFSELRYELDDASELLRFLEPSTQLGGYPAFVQGDPRVAGDRPEQLILQLESMDFDGEDVLMWGDAGNAQLFGDLASLRRSDSSTLWWDWACG